MLMAPCRRVARSDLRHSFQQRHERGLRTVGPQILADVSPSVPRSKPIRPTSVERAAPARPEPVCTTLTPKRVAERVERHPITPSAVAENDVRMEHPSLLRFAHVSEHHHPGAAAVRSPRLLTRDLEKVSEPFRHRRVPRRRREHVHPTPQPTRARVLARRTLGPVPRQLAHTRSGQRDETRPTIPGREVLPDSLGLIAQVDRRVSRTVAPLAPPALPERTEAIRAERLFACA